MIAVGAYALGAGALAVACSSSSDTPMLGDTTHPPGDQNDGAPSRGVGAVDAAAADAPPSGSEDGAAADAGDARADGADGALADGLAADVGAADAAVDSTGAAASDAGPLCDPTRVWALYQRVASVPGADFSRFGGISVSELTIAWTASTGVIYTADRAARTDDFGAPVTIPLPTTIGSSPAQPAIDRVGLGPSGLTLVAIAEVGDGGSQTQLIGFERSLDNTGVYSTWVLSPAVAFENVNAMISTEVDGTFSAPVLSGDGNSLFYVLTSAGVPTLYESRWDSPNGVWLAGTPALPASVLADAGAGARATGTSSDGLTLFFFDIGASKERGAWRTSTTSPFDQFVDEIAIFEAAPNFRCTTIYFQSSDSMGNGAFVAQ